MKSMKIAYIINSVEGGGATQPVPAIAAVLRKAGAEVRVFALTPRDRRGLPAMMQAGLDPIVREGGLGDHAAALWWMKRNIRHWGATHLWTSLSRASILGLMLGPMMGLPVICWQHAAYLKPWNLRLLRLLQSRAMLWVADSRSVEDLTAARLDVEPERLACWPIFAADPEMPVSLAWQAGEPLRIGSLGRLHPVKGYDVLIEALAKIRASGHELSVPIEIAVAGEGDERARLEALAISAGITNLRLIGYANNPRDFLSSLHLYVQPSRSEGFCIAAHEAMTAGLPVIASSVGELPYSISQNVTGCTVSAGDANALAAAMKSMLESPTRLHAMGQAARADMLTRFSWTNFEETGRAIVGRIRQAST